jgi:hypothetical protein
VVVFVDQMSELLDLALEKYHSLTEAQREELATYIIPEVSPRGMCPIILSSTIAVGDVPHY